MCEEIIDIIIHKHNWHIVFVTLNNQKRSMVDLVYRFNIHRVINRNILVIKNEYHYVFWYYMSVIIAEY